MLLICDNGEEVYFDKSRIDHVIKREGNLFVYLISERFFEITNQENIDSFMSEYIDISLFSKRDFVNQLKGK